MSPTTAPFPAEKELLWTESELPDGDDGTGCQYCGSNQSLHLQTPPFGCLVGSRLRLSLRILFRPSRNNISATASRSVDGTPAFSNSGWLRCHARSSALNCMTYVNGG
jgi:hypothetical protein